MHSPLYVVLLGFWLDFRQATYDHLENFLQGTINALRRIQPACKAIATHSYLGYLSVLAIVIPPVTAMLMAEAVCSFAARWYEEIPPLFKSYRGWKAWRD